MNHTCLHAGVFVCVVRIAAPCRKTNQDEETRKGGERRGRERERRDE